MRIKLNLSRLTKYLPLPETPEAAAQMSDAIQRKAYDLVKNKPYLTEYINRINESSINPKVEAIVKPRVREVFSFNEHAIKKLYFETDAELRAESFQKALTVEGLSDKQTFKNAKVFIKQSLRHAEHRYKQGYRLYEQNLLNEFKTKGLETAEAFRTLLKAPFKFQQLYKVSQEQLAAAIYDRQAIPNNEIANNIISSILKTDEAFLKQMQDFGTVVNLPKNHFLPFYAPSDTVNLIGLNKFTDLLTRTTQVDQMQAQEIAAKILMSDTIRDLDSFKNLIYDSNLRFNDGADMVHFFKTLNGKEFEFNIFNKFFNHKQRLMRVSVLQTIYGHTPIETVTKGLLRARKFGKIDKTLDTAYPELIRKFKTQLELLAGKHFISDSTARDVGNIINRSMSLAVAAPSRSTVRNLLIDYEANALSIGESLYNKNFKLGGTAHRVYSNLAYLVGSAFNNQAKKNAVNDLLNIAGWANSIEGLSHGNVLAFEDVFEGDLKKGTSNWLKYTDNSLKRMQHSLFKWSGNHSLLDIVRARRYISLQQLFTTVFKHNTFSEWKGSLTDIELKQLDFLRTNFDLDESAFNFLKEAKKAKVNISNKTYKSLGFDEFPEYISSDSIIETSDFIANKYKLAQETPAQYKQRIARGWQSFVYNATNSFAPVTTVADSLTGPLLVNTNPWLGITLRPHLKFADPAQAQVNAWIEDMAVAVYGRPTQSIGFDGSMVAWGKGLATYTAFGAAAIWAKDLLNNKQPTDFTDKFNAARLVAISGFFGYGNMVAANALGVFPSFSSSVYSGTPAGPILNPLTEIGKAAIGEQSFSDAAIGIGSYNPVSRLWFASGAINYGLNHILLEPRDLKRKYRHLELYGKPYLF